MLCVRASVLVCRREANVAEPPRNGVLRLLYPVTLWLCACRHRPTERYELLNKAGLDAHVFYLFLRRMIYFFILTFFLGIIVAAVNASKGDAFADQLFRFSTDRLPQERCVHMPAACDSRAYWPCSARGRRMRAPLVHPVQLGAVDALRHARAASRRTHRAAAKRLQ